MRKPLIGAVIGVLVLALAGAAVATEQFTQTFKLTYTSKATKSSTGIKLALTTSDPGAPNETPSAAKKITMKFNAGTVFDTSVPTRCNKTDKEVQDSAGKACPSKSKVGTGSAEGKVGDLEGQRAELDAVAYNARNAIIFLFKGKAGTLTEGQNFAFRAKINGSRLTVNVPQFPFNTSITKFNLSVIKVTRGSRRYISTPTKCPTSKKWTTKAQFIYADGTKVNRSSKTSCRSR